MIPDEFTSADWLRMRWYPGRASRRDAHVYAQAGPISTDSDRLVCLADSPELAVHIAAAHNSLLHMADHG